LIEKWASQEALDLHSSTPFFKMSIDAITNKFAAVPLVFQKIN
jgi:quinol monooxygenase YgiN